MTTEPTLNWLSLNGTDLTKYTSSVDFTHPADEAATPKEGEMNADTAATQFGPFVEGGAVVSPSPVARWMVFGPDGWVDADAAALDGQAELLAAIRELTSELRAFREAWDRPTGPARGLTTNIRSISEHKHRTGYRMGFGPAYVELEEDPS